MFCPSCGEQIGESFCPGCGTPSGPPPEDKKPGIGVAGAIVLLLLGLALSILFVLSKPRIPFTLRLPAWMGAGQRSEELRPLPTPTATPVVIIPTPVSAPPPPPPAPRDPYEQLSDTTLTLSDGSRREIRVRLVPDSSLGDVEPLLAARIAELRGSQDIVLVRAYPAGSEGLETDVPLVTLTALRPGADPGELRASGAAEISPGIFRAPAP